MPEIIKHSADTKNRERFFCPRPLKFVAIDILRKLVTTPHKNMYLLIILDRFSELVQTVPHQKITAKAVAKALAVY